MKQALARFAGRCPRCTYLIQVGDPIRYGRGRQARHADCNDPRGTIAVMEAASSPGCGCIPRWR